MSLRQQLLAHAELRSCKPSECNRATSPQSAQQAPQPLRNHRTATLHAASGFSATTTATPTQLTSCASLATDLDPRVTCTACRHLWQGNRCLNHHRAALSSRELAADFTQLRQHCDGFAPLARYSPSVSR